MGGSEEHEPTKLMEIYDDLISNRTQFFSSCDPDLIEESFIAYLRKIKIEPKINKQKYKVTFKRLGLDEFGFDIQDNVESCFRILKVNQKY